MGLLSRMSRAAKTLSKYYSPFTWRDKPSIESPINAVHLNHMEDGINEMDNRILILAQDKADAADMANVIIDFTMDDTTGVMTFTRFDGSTFTHDTAVEKIALNCYLEGDNFVLELADGTKQKVSLSKFIDTYTFSSTDTIRITANGKNISADIPDGKITLSKLEPTILSTIRQYTLDAQTSKGVAEQAASTAQGWAIGGTGFEGNNAKYYASKSQRYAVGGVEEGDAKDNAKAYCEAAKGYAEQCQGVSEFDGTAATVSAVDTQGININTATGTTQVTVSDAWEAPIPGLEIAGKSEQGADPSPDNPQEIVSADVTAVTVTGANMSKTASITLTEPLRGIGDYRDRIMCRGGVWGIERNISMDILTEDTVRPSAGGMNSTYPNCIIDNRYTVIYSNQYSELSKKELYSDGKKTTGYCNIAPAGMVKDWSVVSGGLDNVYSINGLGGIYIAVPITVIGVTETATMDEVNAAIKQYVADNDVYVMFVLDAPTWEPLPAATQSALNALTTYTGQTTITVTADGPEPDITMQYYGQPGAKTNVQSMLDALAHKVALELVSNTDLAAKLADYLKKTDIVQTESTATNKVPSSAYLKQVKDNIDSNLINKGIIDPQSAQANINTDWVSSGTVYYRITNGICFVDFDLTLKTITILNTLIVSGLPTAKIMAHSKLQGWEDNTISVPCYVYDNNVLANPGPAGHYVGSFSYAVR